MYYPKSILQAQIDVTNTCNLRCIHCRANANSIEENISINDFIKIAEELILNGVRRLTISGGEPFLNKDIYLILDWLKKNVDKFDYIGVTTNGFFYSPDFFQRIVAYKDFIHLQISIDGFEKEHDVNRGVPGSHTRTLSNIKKLIALEIYVSTSTTINNQNIDGIEGLIEYLVSEGIKNISFRHEIPTGRSNIMVDFGYKKKYLHLLAKFFCGKPIEYKDVNFYSGDPIRLMVDSQFLKGEKIKDIVEGQIIGGCSVGIISIYIGSNGIIQGCPYLNETIGKTGNNISTLWSDENIFGKFRNRSLLKGNCGSCKWKHVCGGCRAVAKNHGDILGGDDFCLYGFDEMSVFEGYLKRYGILGNIEEISAYPIEGGVFVPLWAQAIVNFEDKKGIEDFIDSNWIKRDIKEIKKRGYSCLISEKEEDLEYFYRELYLEYALSRYSEDELILMPYFFHYNLFQKNGKILFVVDSSGNKIGGYLLSQIGKGCYIATGIGMKMTNEKHSFITSALYYFLLQWGMEHKLNRMSFGKTRIYNEDGVLKFKMKWGVTRLEHDKKGVFLKFRKGIDANSLFYL